MLAASLAFGGAASAGVTFVCDSSIGAALCTQINNTVDPLYSQTFTNANSTIYVTFGNTGLGASFQPIFGVGYAQFRSALAAETNPASGVVRNDALNSLAATEPSLYAGDPVVVTSSLAQALGFGGLVGVDASENIGCTLGNAGCYNGLLTLATVSNLNSEGYSGYYLRTGTETSSEFDIFTVIEHETDEMLGTISCVGDGGSGAVDGCASNLTSPFPSAADLYRYAAPGTLSLVTNNPAYFSYNGGTTDVADYNTTIAGADFGDFALKYTCNQNFVQDAFACAGSTGDITNDGGPEIKLLNAVGYNLVASVPEPDAWALLIVGLGIMGGSLRVARRRNPARFAA